MHQVSPRTGAEEVTLATDQHEYKQLVAALYQVEYAPGMQAPALLTRWRLSDDDLARALGVPVHELMDFLAGRRGEDVYLAQLTFGKPFQPIMLQVGADSETRWTVPDS